MQPAAANTVLGDFSGVTFDHFGESTEFLRNGDAFVVRTRSAAGETRDFTVTETFGVEPLQQYLVSLADGRKQALPFLWDTRAADAGGQRWYHLYDGEYIGPDDPLHWTGRYFNWNVMCAECHSTDVAVNYDAASNTFATTYAEVSVGCEACHGPGSEHVRQARAGSFDARFGLPVDLDDRGDGVWVMNRQTGIAERSERPLASQQTESCGRCHARRNTLSAHYRYGRPLADTHLPALLEDGLYHADGRILDEVYVYGSFVQSRMHAAGVTCTDCHNPHSGRLHSGGDSNAVCAQCHLPETFASAAHGEPAGACVDCHMPATTYMGVDERRDHSLRVPAAGNDPAHYGRAIAAGRAGPANDTLLVALQQRNAPAIATATMLTLLRPSHDPALAAAVAEGLLDADPLVRIGGLRALSAVPVGQRAALGAPLLRDPVRGVRVEAARALADVSRGLPAAAAQAFASALDELRAALTTTASLPESAMQLAELASAQGEMDAAERYYRRALRLDERFAPARHAYGLFLVRAGQAERALEHLRRAAELAPAVARYTYVYGVALHSLGSSEAAVAVLAEAYDEFPGDFDIGWALATIRRDAGDTAGAREVALTLRSRFPQRPEPGALLDSLATMR